MRYWIEWSHDAQTWHRRPPRAGYEYMSVCRMVAGFSDLDAVHVRIVDSTGEIVFQREPNRRG